LERRRTRVEESASLHIDAAGEGFDFSGNDRSEVDRWMIVAPDPLQPTGRDPDLGRIIAMVPDRSGPATHSEISIRSRLGLPVDSTACPGQKQKPPGPTCIGSHPIRQ
jgi:hypothetical protein